MGVRLRYIWTFASPMIGGYCAAFAIMIESERTDFRTVVCCAIFYLFEYLVAVPCTILCLLYMARFWLQAKGSLEVCCQLLLALLTASVYFVLFFATSTLLNFAIDQSEAADACLGL